ncbi:MULTISPECIES: DedA family protein [Bacteria]|uniref:DedA family protein n=1 Tax=Bacteria TaxID=2 RepID=UPI003C7B0432
MNDVLASLALSPWLPIVILLCCFIDGFFPPVPSETVVVGSLPLALAAGSEGVPSVIAILVAAGIGAAAGDNLAYAIGRRLGTDRWAWMRRPRVRKSLVWAGERLAERPAIYLLVARYIPIGRVAVNMTAGATRLPYRRFLPLTLVAAVAWVSLSFAIASVAAAWFGHSPLLAAGAGIAVSILMGFAIDLGVRLVQRARARRGSVQKGVASEAETPVRDDSAAEDAVVAR